MVNGAVKDGTAVDLSSWRPQAVQNSFAGTTVEAIVLEVSQLHPRMRGGARIGVWCATKLATDAGGWRQINRAGHPMMWPNLWPDDTDFSYPANTRHPSDGFDADGREIGELVAAVVAATGTSCGGDARDIPASPPATVGRRPTTHPKQCCPSSPPWLCHQG